MRNLLAGVVATVVIFVFALMIIAISLFRNGGHIDGYGDRVSYARADSVHLRLFDMEGRAVDSVRVRAESQTITTPEPWRYGFGWEPTFRYTVNLPSGVYRWEHTIPFVVRSDADSLDLVVVYPSNTIAAYNRSGGRSLYGPSQPHRAGASLEGVLSDGMTSGIAPSSGSTSITQTPTGCATPTVAPSTITSTMPSVMYGM